VKSRENGDRDVAWRAVLAGYAIALVGTAITGGWGFAFGGHGMWWLANWGIGFLFAGGACAGYHAKSFEPLNGAYIAVFYFGTATLAVFAGEFLRILPDPLPGLPRGDSTFFFVWPLAQLIAATLGAMFGGWLAAARGG
jgi:hypothetical protein